MTKVLDPHKQRQQEFLAQQQFRQAQEQANKESERLYKEFSKLVIRLWNTEDGKHFIHNILYSSGMFNYIPYKEESTVARYAFDHGRRAFATTLFNALNDNGVVFGGTLKEKGEEGETNDAS